MLRRILLLTVIAMLETRAHLNFFITEEEVRKLLGINGDLFYVDKGVINTYALKYVLLIPSSVNEIQFSWQSLLSYSLPYVIAVKYGHGSRGVLLPPEMNISSTGVIPTSVQTFSIKLMCTGVKDAEITVEVQLYVSTHRHRNATRLKFRRNKLCNEGIGNSRNDSIRFEPGFFDAATSSLYVAVACTLAMITLVVVTTSAVCIKKKSRQQESTYMTAIYDSNPHMFLRSLGRPPSVESGSYATIASVHKGPPSPSPYATSDACPFYATSDTCRVSYYASSQIMVISQLGEGRFRFGSSTNNTPYYWCEVIHRSPATDANVKSNKESVDDNVCVIVPLLDPRLADPIKRLRSLSVLRQSIGLECVSEEGIFGKVYLATYRQQTVIVKTTKETASKRLVNLFLAEGTMMYGMEHKNILTILCVNLDDPRQPLLVFPHCNRGNLKRFLINSRKRRDTCTILSTQSLIDMAIQILLGMMYLHSQNICYKDVAVRNAVVDETLHVRITDNSLSRDMFPNDYFCLWEHESQPVKWMALESLTYNQYSAATDVWSFGVVLWELTTLAQQPFPDIDPFEMSTYLRNGFRLGQPFGCPDELFAMMTYCWLNCPSERPQLNHLLAYLQDFYTALCRFV